MSVHCHGCNKVIASGTRNYCVDCGGTSQFVTFAVPTSNDKDKGKGKGKR